MKVFILNLLEPTNMCQCFLRVLAQTSFSPHFLLSQRLRENTNGDVLYSSLQSSRKLPAHVLPEGELWDQRAFFTKEFLTKWALTMYAAQAGLSPPWTPSPFTLMTSHKVHVFIIPVLQLGNEAEATEPKPALCEQVRNWTQGHVSPRPLHEEGPNLHEKPPSGKREGRRTHVAAGLLSQRHPTLVQDVPPAHFKQRSSNLSFSNVSLRAQVWIKPSFITSTISTSEEGQT